jgi:hypothetical protein
MMDGEITDRFLRAINDEEVDAALDWAKQMSYVGLGDSLNLVRLLARKRDPRFDRYANRWVARWVVEKGASAGEVSIAAAAMGALAVDPDSERVITALRAVTRSD